MDRAHAFIPPPALPAVLLAPLDGSAPVAIRRRSRSLRPHLRAMPQTAQGVVITKYDHQAHGLDFLIHLWASLEHREEHLQLFGPIAAQPMEFVKHYVRFELFVLHEPEAAWQQVDGVMAVVWSDDWVPRARYRLHFYVFPAYRHPTMTRQLGQGILHHLFDVCLYENVWGLTPASNRLALRFLWRLGFHDRIFRPRGTIDCVTREPVDVIESWMRYDEWAQTQYVREAAMLREEAMHRNGSTP